MEHASADPLIARRRVLITGARGQLGHALAEAFAGDEVTGVDLPEYDISRPLDLPGEWDLILHAAAWTDVDGAEADPQGAAAVNVGGTRNVAALPGPLLYFSTDYVFDGRKGAPYVEADPVSPLNVYGASKVAGEHAVLAYCRRSYVVRSCGLYGIDVCRAKGENFVTKMLRLAREQGEVAVVDDEIVTPTWTFGLARQIRRLCTRDDVPHGIVHASSQGHCSWYEFAAEIFRQAGVDAKLHSARVADFPSPIRRPHYSVLENRALASAGADEMPDWQTALSQHLAWQLRGVSPAPT